MASSSPSPTCLQTLLDPAGISEQSAGVITVMGLINLGGLVVALVVQILVHEPLAALLAMAAVSLPGVPLAARFPLARPRSLGSASTVTGS